ncbi:head-tail connector protein [Sphingobium sp. AN558]|uniref:head-tail connector protein n=1 Tax=Sphingobium sp. AN558 TaxID=3133442 RepID=UPI0030C0F8C4
MLAETEQGAPGAALAELKAYLRIETGDEDAVLAGLLRGATALCEQFIGQWLIIREGQETVAADAWRRLSARPVVEILSVASAGDVLPVDAYAVDIDALGEGWVRAVRPVGSGLLTVRYRAGLALELNGLPEPIRQGIVRLAAEHFSARNGDVGTPPAVVSALWRPWRRMRLA